MIRTVESAGNATGTGMPIRYLVENSARFANAETRRFIAPTTEMSQRAAPDSRSPDVATMRVGSGSWFCGLPNERPCNAC